MHVLWSLVSFLFALRYFPNHNIYTIKGQEVKLEQNELYQLYRYTFAEGENPKEPRPVGTLDGKSKRSSTDGKLSIVVYHNGERKNVRYTFTPDGNNKHFLYFSLVCLYLPFETISTYIFHLAHTRI